MTPDDTTQGSVVNVLDALAIIEQRRKRREIMNRDEEPLARKYKITEVREAYEATIKELLQAIARATKAGNRACARNLENKVLDILNILYGVEHMEEYITQWKFRKYFEEENKT